MVIVTNKEGKSVKAKTMDWGLVWSEKDSY
jgi:hypothetical protein